MRERKGTLIAFDVPATGSVFPTSINQEGTDHGVGYQERGVLDPITAPALLERFWTTSRHSSRHPANRSVVITKVPPEQAKARIESVRATLKSNAQIAGEGRRRRTALPSGSTCLVAREAAVLPARTVL